MVAIKRSSYSVTPSEYEENLHKFLTRSPKLVGAISNVSYDGPADVNGVECAKFKIVCRIDATEDVEENLRNGLELLPGFQMMWI